MDAKRKNLQEKKTILERLNPNTSSEEDEEEEEDEEVSEMIEVRRCHATFKMNLYINKI